jgi:hypothetical protein
MCKIAVWASRTSMRGLKVIEFRYPEISDLRFDQPPFLIDYMILILVTDLIFILRDVLDTTIWPTRSYYEERFAKRNQSLIIEGFVYMTSYLYQRNKVLY